MRWAGGNKCAVAIRTPKEIAKIRAACRLGREVLDKAHAAIRPGVTTDEIDRIVLPISLNLPATACRHVQHPRCLQSALCANQRALRCQPENAAAMLSCTISSD